MWFGGGSLQVYLVGGAVRDAQLELEVVERDWVVVGAVPEELLAQGYKAVGKSFPVFIHPQTGEEYALARTERKVGPGYTGFDFHAAPDVSLEQDLQRRDLTINAIAQTEDGELIDPYHGLSDLKARVMRHVSPAFVEDPLRVLRVARFMARYAQLGFHIANETQQMMQTIVQQGEMLALTPERVWQELQRALAEPSPEVFFTVLDDCGALAELFPTLCGCDLAREALLRATEDNRPEVRFAVVFAACKEFDARALIQQYRIPKLWGQLLILSHRFSEDYCLLHEASARGILIFFSQLDAFRQTDRFKKILTIMHYLTESDTTKNAWIMQLFDVAAKVDVQKIMAQGARGQEINERLAKRRVQCLKASGLIKSY